MPRFAFACACAIVVGLCARVRAQPAPDAAAPAVVAPDAAAPEPDAAPAGPDVDAAVAGPDAAPALTLPPATPPPPIEPSTGKPPHTTFPVPHPAAPPAAGAAAGSAVVASGAEAAGSRSAANSTFYAIKIIAGLVILIVLAYLGGHPRVAAYQQRLGISSIVAAGFPFVALGMIASLPGVGVLDRAVLDQLSPVMQFGLGWLGFIIGAQLDIRVLDNLPKGTAYLILVEALAPFAAAATACSALMIAFGVSIRDPALWRDAILLGTAAAMTAPRRFHGFANRAWVPGDSTDILIGQLDEIVGVVGLLFVTAYFRAESTGTWILPQTAWLLVSVGLGVMIGVLIFAMIRVPVSNAEFLAVVLGGIAFAAGLAGYLKLSPIVIAFVAGALVVNFPNEQREAVFRILHRLERPVHLLFLILLGAVWQVSDWRGWVMVPVFVAARIAGKWLGMYGARTALGGELAPQLTEHRRLIVPMSSLSIALAVSLQSLYHDTALPWLVTAVIGGAIAFELIVQGIEGPPPPGPALEPAGDDLDSGPTYVDLGDL